MNREYNSRVSSKNSDRLLKNLKNATGDYFFLPHPVVRRAVKIRVDVFMTAVAKLLSLKFFVI